MSKNRGLLAVIGIVGSVIGAAASMLNAWVKDRDIDDRIDAKIDKALTDKEESTEEEES